MFELETQIILILATENISLTNLPEENQNDDVKIIFPVFNYAGNFSKNEVN